MGDREDFLEEVTSSLRYKSWIGIEQVQQRQGWALSRKKAFQELKDGCGLGFRV